MKLSSLSLPFSFILQSSIAAVVGASRDDGTSISTTTPLRVSSFNQQQIQQQLGKETSFIGFKPELYRFLNK